MKSKIIIYRIFLPIFFMALIFLACKEPEGDPGLTGPKGDDGSQGPKLVGSLSGYIFLWGVNGSTLPPSSSSTVSVEGTEQRVNCDSTGRWQLDSLETGTYDLDFQLDGFGTFIKKSFQFIGEADVFYGIVTLGQIPEFYVDSLSIGFDYGYNQLVISGTISNPNPTVSSNYLYLFAGTDSNISSDPKNIFMLNKIIRRRLDFPFEFLNRI